MKKTINLQLNPSKTSRNLIFKIELREHTNAKDFDTLELITNTYELSICGATHKNGCICQNQDYIISYRNRVRKQDLATFDFIMDIWNKYHLNTFKMGTKAQTEAIEKAKIFGYVECCNFLKEINLYEDRGYKYGCGWLCETIPSDIIEKIKSL